jgi:hypothetical protein
MYVFLINLVVNTDYFPERYSSFGPCNGLDPWSLWRLKLKFQISRWAHVLRGRSSATHTKVTLTVWYYSILKAFCVACKLKRGVPLCTDRGWTPPSWFHLTSNFVSVLGSVTDSLLPSETGLHNEQLPSTGYSLRRWRRSRDSLSDYFPHSAYKERLMALFSPFPFYHFTSAVTTAPFDIFSWT